MSPAFRWIAVLALAASSECCWAAEPCDEAVAAVVGWYATIGNGSNQRDLLDYGTVGGGPQPLTEAYGQLDDSLRGQMSEAQFLTHFRGLAQLKLLQAHAACQGEVSGAARVFVEEGRTFAIEGIPGIAWYWGFVTLAKTPLGWRISELKGLRPEDIISLALGGHMPYRENPDEVAMVYLQCARQASCKLIESSRRPAAIPAALANPVAGPDFVVIVSPDGTRRTVPRPPRKPLGQTNAKAELATVTVEVNGTRRTVELARLHSGEWIVLNEHRQK